MLPGIKRRYKRIDREVSAVALARDGGVSEVVFLSMSGAAERREEILFICIDDEGDMKAGMQRTSRSPHGAWTWTTPVGERARGKTQDAKNLPVTMMMHNCAHIATASAGFKGGLYAKLDRAIAASNEGFAYLRVYSPCATGWRLPSQDDIEVTRKTVEIKFVLFWEFGPARMA